MRLSAEPNHPNYHDVVNFVTDILVDGAIRKTCVSIDTVKNEAVCFTQPFKVINGVAQTHVIKGKIDIIWRSFAKSGNLLIGNASENLFLSMKRDWEKRGTT